MVWCALFYVLSGVLVFVLLWVGNHFAGLCEEMLIILFSGVLPEWQVQHSFYVIPVSCQFVFIGVGGCKMYSSVCCCRFSVNIEL